MAKPSRRIIAALLSVPILLLAADTAAWVIATSRLRTAYLAWQSSLAAQGWRLTADPPATTGWPVAALLRLDNTRLAQTPSGGFGWSAPSVSFGIALLHPHQLDITPHGRQTLTGPGWPALNLHADSLIASTMLDAPIQAATATALNLAIETDAGDAVADQVSVAAAWQPDALDLTLTAGPITLPASHPWGLGQTITTASLSLLAHGAWPADRSTAAATQWRDSGGTLDIPALRLQWGTLDVAGSGHAGLDAALQPDATLDLQVADPAAALATLADAGAISRDVATAAGAVLSLLAIPAQHAGSPGILPLPLQLHSGTLTLGQIPLLRVPALRWTRQ